MPHPLLQPDKPGMPGNVDKVKIPFTNQGKQNARWALGLHWSVIRYRYGGHALTTHVIQLKREPVKPPAVIGLNKALNSKPTLPPMPLKRLEH